MWCSAKSPDLPLIANLAWYAVGVMSAKTFPDIARVMGTRLALAASRRAGASRREKGAPGAPDIGLAPRRHARARHGGKRPVAVLKIAPFWKPAKGRSSATVVPLEGSPGLDAFGSESAPTPSTRPAPASVTPRPPKLTARRISTTTWVAATLVVLLVAALGVTGYKLRGRPFPWTPKTGSITFDTVPAGIEVFVGERTIGRSPTTAALTPGSYDVRLGSGPQARAFKVTVATEG